MVLGAFHRSLKRGCRALWWMLGLALVFVGGACLLKWLYRADDDTTPWYTPDGTWIAYGVISVAIVLGVLIIFAIVVAAIEHTLHCIFCGPLVRCIFGRSAPPPADDGANRLRFVGGGDESPYYGSYV